MTDIFLSYRSADSAFAVAEIWKRLAERFGREHVFRDDDSIRLGTAYAAPIRAALAASDVVAAVIGPLWFGTDAGGTRRIDDPADWVRYELRTAYQLEIPVIPVLLGDTPLPTPEQLPADIALLARSQFWRIGHRQTESDIAGLVRRLLHEAGHTEQPRQEDPPTRPTYYADRGSTNTIADRGSTIVTNHYGNQSVTNRGIH
ncbi:toll/interleukin-1 receptor domain-containing protein [Nocardia sp. NPDC050697]|uniref:toll/interleukin-1 receptor domain-containing protein n=1 Tax=Nocardia sp. NPDC050697 TaxID=3155158 RepID=UPI003405D277